MAWFSSIGASLTRPASPAITFMEVRPVLSLGLLLLEANKHQDAFNRLHAFIYACLIYDQYSTEWKEQRSPPRETQLDSWLELSRLPGLAAQDTAALKHTFHSHVIGNVKLPLPIPSLEPERQRRGIVAPRSYRGTAPTQVQMKDITFEEFIEVAYMVRCNLLHGSYDIRNDDHAGIIMYTALRFCTLVVWMVKKTKWD